MLSEVLARELPDLAHIAGGVDRRMKTTVFPSTAIGPMYSRHSDADCLPFFVETSTERHESSSVASMTIASSSQRGRTQARRIDERLDGGSETLRRIRRAPRRATSLRR